MLVKNGTRIAVLSAIVAAIIVGGGVSSVCLGAKNGNPPAPKAPNPGPEPQAPATTALDNAQQTYTSDQTAATTADTALANLTAKLKKDFEATPEMSAALADLKTAQAAYDPALVKVRESLKSNADYKAAQAAVKSAAQAEKELPKSTSTDQLASPADTTLLAEETVRKLEFAAMDADPATKDIRAKYEAALGKVTEMHAAYDQALQADHAYKEAKANTDAAHAKVDADKKALDSEYAKYESEMSSYATKLQAWASKR